MSDETKTSAGSQSDVEESAASGPEESPSETTSAETLDPSGGDVPASPEEPTEPPAPADGDRVTTETAITQGSALEPEPDEPDASAYQLTLPSFHGPLDLLLHLIRKHEVDIYDIPIVLITEQYNAYLEAMTELDLDIAADYIYMAALLINIKSRMLLPRDESAEDLGDDPRRELVDRLLEYQRFKAVAESFAELDVVRMGMWARPRMPPPGSDDQTDVDMTDVGLFDLIDAFRTALVRYRQNHPQAIEMHRVVHKVSDKMREIYAKLHEMSPIRLQWFLEGRDRNELIAVFLGMLELVRLGGVALQQKDNFSEILISRGTAVDEETFQLFDNS